MSINQNRIRSVAGGGFLKGTSVWWLVLCLFMATIALSTFFAPYMSDAIQYGFKTPRNYDYSDNQYQPIDSLTDVFESQYNHFFSTNGRLFVHTLVQIFCGLTDSRLPFVVCNTIVWVALLLLFMRVCRKDWKNPVTLSLMAGLLLVAFWINYDPAFQINYVWTAAMVSGWLLIIREKEKLSNRTLVRICQLASIFAFSVLAGNCNEAFSFPVLGALACCVIAQRFRLTDRQWVCVVGFVAGTLVILLSPAAWERLLEISDADNFNPNFPRLSPREAATQIVLQNYFVYLWVAVYFGVYGLRNGLRQFKSYWHRNIYLLVIILLSEAVGCIDSNSAVRTLLCSKLCFAYMIIDILSAKSVKCKYLSVLLTAACVIAFAVHFDVSCKRYSEFELKKEKIRNLAMSDSILWYGTDEMKYWTPERNAYMNWERWSKNRNAPQVRIAPEALRQIPFEKDTNALVRIADRYWLMVQSKTKPAEFVVDRRLGLEGFSYPLAPRVIILSQNEDCYIMETEKWRAGVYVPRNEMLQADVRMIQNKLVDMR